jgi:hypothetical protein
VRRVEQQPADDYRNDDRTPELMLAKPLRFAGKMAADREFGRGKTLFVERPPVRGIVESSSRVV